MIETEDKDVKTATINKYLKEHRNIERKISYTDHFRDKKYNTRNEKLTRYA